MLEQLGSMFQLQLSQPHVFTTIKPSKQHHVAPLHYKHDALYYPLLRVRDGWYPNFPGIGYQEHLTSIVSGIINTVWILVILDI